MNKLSVLFTVFLLMISMSVFAAQGDAVGSSQQPMLTGGAPEDTNKPMETGSDNSSSSGQGQQADVATQNQGDDSQLMAQQQMRSQLSAQEKDGIQNMMRQRQEEMDKEQQGASQEKQEALKNQNQVRLAVHALLAIENYAGGIGKNVSAIAKEFNNSIRTTMAAEERIQSKSGIARFFSGGDEESAVALDAEVSKNQEKIKELKLLKEQCQCDEEVRMMMQEQIQNMEQEQTRLQQLAAKEKKSKGMLGWMWK